MSSSWPEIMRWSVPPWLVPHVLLYLHTGSALLKNAPVDLFPDTLHPLLIQEKLKAVPTVFPSNPMFHVRTCAEGLSGFKTPNISETVWKDSKLGRWVSDGLAQASIIDPDKEYPRFASIVCPLLFLMLNSVGDPHRSDLETECAGFAKLPRELVPKTAAIAKFFANDLQQQLRSPTAETVLRELASFCVMVMNLYTSMMALRTHVVIQQAVPPSFMSMRDKVRLVMLMLHPNQNEVIKSFPRRMCPIRGHRATKGWLDATAGINIDFESWVEMCRYLPTPAEIKNEFKATRFIEQFECLVWTPGNKEITPPPLLKEEERVYYRPVYVSRYTLSGVLMQIFTLMLDNWGEIWTRMGWPRNRTVQLRIKKLMEIRWAPDVKQLGSVFFPA